MDYDLSQNFTPGWFSRLSLNHSFNYSCSVILTCNNIYFLFTQGETNLGNAKKYSIHLQKWLRVTSQLVIFDLNKRLKWSTCFGIVWFERFGNDQKRTLVNKLTSFGFAIAGPGIVLIHSLEMMRYFIGKVWILPDHRKYKMYQFSFS